MSEQVLSELINGDGMTRWRQEFEMRRADPIEFKDDKDAIRFLELFNVTLEQKPKYVSSGDKIWLIEGKDIYYYCDLIRL